MVLGLCIFALLFFGCADLERNKFYEGDDPGVVGNLSSGGGQGNSSGSHGGYSGPYGSVLYGGQTYKTVVIGTQTWMAENLNYNPGTGRALCYNNQASNCTTYGRLYDWSTAMALPSSCNDNYCEVQARHKGICPDGWHLPNDSELQTLVDFAGGSETAGGKLKATSGWNNNSNGTDEYGFAALPGSIGVSDGTGKTVYFSGLGGGGYWWKANESTDISAHTWHISIAYSEKVDIGSTFKFYPSAVRCIEDSGEIPGSSSSGFVSKCGDYDLETQYCSNGTIKDYGLVSHGGRTYKTVEIGEQVWFAENLSSKYGWTAAMTACPAGWHVPSNAEWQTLADFAGGYEIAGGKLKATSGWNNKDDGSSGNGTDDYGFAAKQGGGQWWSATDEYSGAACPYVYHGNEGLSGIGLGGVCSKGNSLSVRCVRG